VLVSPKYADRWRPDVRMMSGSSGSTSSCSGSGDALRASSDRTGSSCLRTSFRSPDR
jgi:hypothetical protein